MEEIGTFEQRLAVGGSAEADLKRRLGLLGFTFSDDGQERNISPEMHAAMRYNNTDLTVRAIRHRPDMLAYRKNFGLAHWEAKSSTRDHLYTNFTIEKDCYDELMALHKSGRRVVVAFRKSNWVWVAQWVQFIAVNQFVTDSNRRKAAGSMTPYAKIDQKSFHPLLQFIYNNTERK